MSDHGTPPPASAAFSGHWHDWKPTPGGGWECACGASRRPAEAEREPGEGFSRIPLPGTEVDLSDARAVVMHHVHGDLEAHARSFNEGYALAMIHALGIEPDLDEDDTDALAKSWPAPTVYQSEAGEVIIVLREPGVRIAGGDSIEVGGPARILGIVAEGDRRRSVAFTRRDS